MKLVVGTVAVLLACFVTPAPAGEQCTLGESTWYCSYECCFDYTGCCKSVGASFWYAWLLLSLLLLVCLCACIGCGGYGYRRYYVVRRYPTASYVTTAAPAPTTYQQYPTQYSTQYKPYAPPKDPPPPYNPAPYNPTYGTY